MGQTPGQPSTKEMMGTYRCGFLVDNGKPLANAITQVSATVPLKVWFG